MATSDTLSINQIIGLEKQVGIPRAKWATGAAIAEAESGGRIGAVGTNTGQFANQKDLGLWQIGYDPTRNLHTEYDPERLVSDPLYNARAFADISNKGADFSQWTTFKTGAYRRWLRDANTVVSTGNIDVTPPPDSPVSSNWTQYALIGGALLLALLLIRR